jgi:MHS family shikimate/dehydroshikimate transporter-like MFS transporter
LPTYETIGVWAPLLLVTVRIAQGIGIGGEWAGAVLMAVEHAPPNKRGFAGAWPQMGAFAGLLLSTLVYTVVSTTLNDQQFFAWGWRVPFLLSLLLIAVGLFIRIRILETPVFTQMKESGAEHRRPLMAVVRDHRKSVLLAIGMRFAENGLFYVFTVFVLSYGQTRLNLPRSTMLAGVSIAAFIGMFSNLFFGSLSDRVGRRPVYLFGAVFSLLFAYPFFWLVDTGSAPLIWLAIVLGVNVGHDAMYGPQAAYFSELFGAGVRYSGASLAAQLSSVFAGGFAPLIAFGLLSKWGSGAVAAYMSVLGLITVVATWMAPETYRGDIGHARVEEKKTR